MTKQTESSTRGAERAVGFAIYGACVAGVLALIIAVIAFFAGRWQEAGICLVASAVAFGALANALLRS